MAMSAPVPGEPRNRRMTHAVRDYLAWVESCCDDTPPDGLAHALNVAAQRDFAGNIQPIGLSAISRSFESRSTSPLVSGC